MKRYKENVKVVLYCLAIILMCTPSVVITLYTYPIQDDFYNTAVILEEIAQGKNAFIAAWSKAIDGYTTYSGYYFSLFLTYFTDAVVQCDIWGIRITQFIMAVCFYFSLSLFMFCVVKQVMCYSTEIALQTTVFLIACMTCLHYFSDNEDLYWFCASVIYLIPMIFILVNSVLIIFAIKNNSKLFLLPISILGFLAGGAVLNIAALGCIFVVMLMYWGIVVKKKFLISITSSIPMIVGGILNVIAPGNFVRKGTPITGELVIETLFGTFQYVLERYEMFFLRQPLFPAMLVALFIILLRVECTTYKYKFYVPLVFLGVMFLAVMITIFPVALGYGIGIYAIMERSNFISDLAMFLFSFLSIFYWRGWLAIKYPCFVIRKSNKMFAYVAIICIFSLAFYKTNIREIAMIRQLRELTNGRIKEYAEWNVSIIEEVEASEDDIVKIETYEPVDRTCLVGPKHFYGEYDYENAPKNRSMLKFYGKKAIYIYNLNEE